MFADLSTEGTIGVIVGVATPLAGIIALLLKQTGTYRERMTRLEIEKNTSDAELKEKADGEAQERFKEVYDMMMDQLTRLSQHSASQDALIGDLVSADNDCQVELERIYGVTLLMHSNMNRCINVLRKLGNNDFEQMEMPERPRRRTLSAKMEFLQKQTAQDAVVLEAITDKLKTIPVPEKPKE